MKDQKTNFATPIAIIVAGALIAAALYFALGASSTNTGGVTDTQPTVPVAGVQADDHIKGNPDAYPRYFTCVVFFNNLVERIMMLLTVWTLSI